MNRPNPENLTPLSELASNQLPVVESDAATPPQNLQQPLESNKTGMDESKSPQELIDWALQKFADQPIVMTSSFGMEGCMLMDMCSKAITKYGLGKLTIACIDTGFFFPETKQLQKKLIAKYENLNFVTWETPVSIEQQAKSYGPNLWQYNPNLCCNIRKVQPMSENVVNFNLWITAVRRSQTASRANTPVMGWDWRYQLLKFCPLVTLSRAEVWQYIQDNDVPFNQLHLQNYPSVSCFHCTKAVPGSAPDSDARGGRWSDNDDKDECGLHYQI
jgi:phosphoadenosine phosphosulfate reductase